MKLFFQILVVLFCGLWLSHAQPGKEVLAKVLDLNTEEPISYASIRFKFTTQGIVANDDGTFRMPMAFLKKDITLVISAIGYATTEIKTSQLSEGLVNNIYIPPQITTLDAVVLELDKREREKLEEIPGVLSAAAIVRTAINNIKYNYPTVPHSYISYYRDYQKFNDGYYNLNEGVLETFDEGINWPKSHSDSIRSALYSFELNSKYPVDSALLKANYGYNKFLSESGEVQLGTPIDNELALLKIHNPVRNFDVNSFSFINVFTEDFLEQHEFELLQIVFENEVPLYEVSFSSKSSVNDYYIGEGRIFISRDTYAIYRLDYGVYSEPLQVADARFTRENGYTTPTFTESEDSDKRISHFEVSISYTKVNKSMYPSYITFNNRFEVEVFDFKVEEIRFDRETKTFTIKTNNPIDPETVKKKNVRIAYKNRKLIVKDVRLLDRYTIHASVLWRNTQGALEEVKPDDFDFQFRKISDVHGTRIDKARRLIGYQFRELFTQEIFETYGENRQLEYIIKDKALRFSPLNDVNVDRDKYWVNSPLKQKVSAD